MVMNVKSFAYQRGVKLLKNMSLDKNWEHEKLLNNFCSKKPVQICQIKHLGLWISGSLMKEQTLIRNEISNFKVREDHW